VTTLAERIRDERQRAGLTKTALARPRYTVSYVSQIESGRRTPSPDAIAYFAGRLGLAASYLATGVPENAETELRYRLEDARLALRDRRAEEAEATALHVREEAERFGVPGLRAQAVRVLADVRTQQSRLREAIDLYEDALEADLSPSERGTLVAALARAYLRVGDLSYAADLIESFLQRREAGQPLDPGVATDLQTVLVSLYYERGDMLRAERTAARAVATADQHVSPEMRAKAYWAASRVLSESGRWGEALELIGRARALYEYLDDRRQLARVLNAMAVLYLEAEPPRTPEAAAQLDRAEAVLSDVGTPNDLAYVLTERARIAVIEHRYEAALVHADRALTNVNQEDLEVGRALRQRGLALQGLGRLREARGSLRDAATWFAKHGAREQEASCWKELGEIELAEGDLAAAVDALRSGLEALVPDRSRA
jgi:tetratricopeptide (TPR) repeat protein